MILPFGKTSVGESAIMEFRQKSPRSRHIVATQAAGEPQTRRATETVKAPRHRLARPAQKYLEDRAGDAGWPRGGFH